ncbi:MAG: hypothetical protein HQM09_06465 [Candidatus Riflebacteria bacterium]|nr:hypothetical protein [Candidatus Riflebacteria bacterium]
MSLHNTKAPASVASPIPTESASGVLVNIVIKITITVVLVGAVVWATM